MEQLFHAVVLAASGLGVALLGRWGRMNAPSLVAGHLEVDDRDRRIRAMKRGAVACYVAAVCLLAASVLAVL